MSQVIHQQLFIGYWRISPIPFPRLFCELLYSHPGEQSGYSLRGLLSGKPSELLGRPLGRLPGELTAEVLGGLLDELRRSLLFGLPRRLTGPSLST